MPYAQFLLEKFYLHHVQLFPHVELTLGPKYRLTVKSPYLFSGYLNQPYPQSWTTDDLGTLKNNHLYLFGRRSDIIEHGANKIFPEEIERMAKDLCEEFAEVFFLLY